MRLETAIRATPSNPTAEGCPVGLTSFWRRCWARTTESCLSRALCSVSPDHHGARPHIHRWAGGPGGRRGVDGARPICVGVESARQREVAARPGTARVAGDASAELDELAAIYEAKGVSPRTAAQVDAELRFDPGVLADLCRRRPRLQCRSRSDRCDPARCLVATNDVSASRHLHRRADRVGAGGCAQRTYRREPRRPRRVAGGDRRPGPVSPTRAGSPLFATGVNRRRDPYSQF